MLKIGSEQGRFGVSGGDEPLRAGAVTRHDWAEPTHFEVGDLPEEQREFLAARWVELGLGDHAGVARFAGLLVYLLSVGAPWDLVVRVEQAIFSVTRHAGLRFDVASGFSGRDVGPGTLPAEAASWGTSQREVVRRAFFEGCVGKSLAALEAEWAAEQTSSPELADVLAEVARNERAHAELFFRFLAWELRRSPQLVDEVGEWLGEMTRAEPERVSRVELCSSDAWIEEFGLVPDDVREALSAEAWSNVLSCVEGILRGLGRHETLGLAGARGLGGSNFEGTFGELEATFGRDFSR